MPRKGTKETFITDAIAKHGDKFDYSKFIFVNYQTKGIIICKPCNYEFEQKPTSHVRSTFKGNCKKCLLRAYVKCLQCNQDTKNAKFCSRTCSAIFNNSKYPKRKLKVVNCIRCEKPVERKKFTDLKTVCKECKDIPCYVGRTLKDYKKRNHFHQPIRSLARTVYRASDMPQDCLYCGFDLVDICHIKDIKDFKDDALITDINSISNLIALCPNHHRMFDRGLLTYNQILRKALDV